MRQGFLLSVKVLKKGMLEHIFLSTIPDWEKNMTHGFTFG
jgi:hypothetical protein